MGLTVLPIEVRDRLAGAELNYREAGATAGNLPAGYHQFTRSVPIGYGRQLFAAAGDGPYSSADTDQQAHPACIDQPWGYRGDSVRHPPGKGREGYRPKVTEMLASNRPTSGPGVPTLPDRAHSLTVTSLEIMLQSRAETRLTAALIFSHAELGHRSAASAVSVSMTAACVDAA